MVISKAKKLLNFGYQVVPITSTGEPLVSGFNKAETEYNEQQAEHWESVFPEAYLALVAGKNNVYVLDVDVDNVKLATQLKKVIRKKWKNIPIRSCNDPRFAVIFLAKPDLQNVTNAHSKGYKNNNKGSLQQIELMGKKLITLFGKHRKTNATYHWSKIGHPSKTHIEDLPSLGLKDIKNIFSFFEKRVPDTFENSMRSSFSVVKEDTFENSKQKVVYTDDEVDEIIEQINGDDRDPWIRVGWALHDHYDGKKKGLLLWNEWAKRFEGYQGFADQRNQWKGMRVDGGVTVHTLTYDLPKKKKNKDDRVKDLLEDTVTSLVIIEKNKQVGDLRKQVSESLCHISEAQFVYSGVTVPKMVRDGRTGKYQEQQVPLMKAWANEPDRILCKNIEYYPSTQRILENKWKNRNEKYYNTYEAPVVERVQRDSLIEHFLNHLKYLFPNKGDDVWFLSWMAHLVRYPHIRYRVAPLSISTHHGTGRGWLSQLLHELVGFSNLSKIGNIGEIVRDGAKNGFLYSTTLCIVAETYIAGVKKYSVDNRLRDILGENYQNIDIKYGEQKDRQVFTRMFFQSNHIDGLGIDELDNRLEVLLNTAPPKSSSYYDKIYKLLGRDDFVNQVYSYLMTYDIVEKDLKCSRQTPARDIVIKANKSKTANAFYEFKLLVGQEGLFLSKYMYDFIDRYFVEQQDEQTLETVNDKELGFLIREQLRTRKTFKTRKNRITVRAFAPLSLKKERGEIPSLLKNTKMKIEQYFKQKQENYL